MWPTSEDTSSVAARILFPTSHDHVANNYLAEKGSYKYTAAPL